MPREITSREEMEKLLAGATKIRVVKGKDKVKLKVRTNEMLYTFKTSEDDAEALIKGLKAEVVEF